MARGYEAKILRAFRLLVKDGHVYRGLKPVQWCITCETALAEAEVEYKDKTSPSVYVALPVVEGELKGAEIVVWTTTPWTLPANRAAAFHPSLEYVEVAATVAGRPRRLIVAKARLESLVKETGAEGARNRGSWTGEKITALLPRYALPYETKPGETGVSVLAEYDKAEDGTGIVHTAPGHGEDDFHTGRRYDLEILNPVDGAGRFTDKAPRWSGKKIFDEGNPEIIADLRERGWLLARKDIKHSYPHCWRCKNPVVFRTTEQWFLRLSEDLRERLLAQIDATAWVPAGGRARIASMVANRPDWCLSRQRVWGTPITVLYSAKSGEAVLDDGVLEAIEKKAAADGSDFWFEKWGEVLTRKDWPFLPDHPALKDGFKRESDILDVWLDSGVSWSSVLGEDAVADLYLEGSDQHRGWFQSSLVMSTALRGHAPYKAVLTHGFVLDEKGRAMHKSTGNVVAPQEVISKRGADVLRLWTALSDYSDDVRISEKILDGPAESYRRVRNTLRFLLGNLSDFDPASAVAHEGLPEMERFFLHRLAALSEEETLCGLPRVPLPRARAPPRGVLRDVLPRRDQGQALHVPRRRAGTVGRADGDGRGVPAPVRAAVTDPVLHRRRGLAFLAPAADRKRFPVGPAPARPALDRRRARRALGEGAGGAPPSHKALEEAPAAAKTIGSSLQAKVVLSCPPETLDALKGLNVPEFLIVSEAALRPGAELSAAVSAADGAKCPRCWRWQADLGSDPSQPELCGRCARQLS